MTVEVKICPRCSQPYKYTEKRKIKQQIYYYAIHISFDENNKKHVHKCYLGAETYIYVKRVHADSSIQFHGYIVEDRYKQYARDIRDYLSRDKKYNRSETRKKTIAQAEIDPFVKKLYSKAKWRVSIVALNSLYQKYLQYALELGMKVERYNNLFETLDPTLTYSELEQYISMNLEGVGFVREY